MRSLCVLLAVLCLTLTTGPTTGVGRTFSNLLDVFRPRPPHRPRTLFFSWRDRQLGGAKFTWDQANYQCTRRGQRLVSIEDYRKNDYIVSVLTQDRVPFIWTSGRVVHGRFVWTATGRPVRYTNWSRTGGGGRPQPDNRERNEFCLAVLNRFYPGDGVTWHDIACHHEKPFICE